jgi:Fic family protein
MAYIYKKVIQGKSYYYLRLSKRVKGKIVVKDIAYLGNDIAKIQKKLDELPKKYKGEIRKTYRNIKKYLESNYYLEKIKKKKLKEDLYLDKESLESIEAIRLHYNKKFLKLDNLTQKEIYKNFLIDFAYNTTSIEGNTISLKEAHRLLTEQITPKDKTLREIYDLQNTEEVFFNLLENKPRISEKLIIDIHDQLMEKIDKRKGYRSHELRVFKAGFKATPAKYVTTDMKLLLQWYNKNKKELHPFVLSGIFHHKFEKIHPFADGNGRAGRMILSYLCVKERLPPFIIYKKNRKEYRKSLASADKAGLNNSKVKDYRQLIGYLSEELIGSYWNNFLF